MRGVPSADLCLSPRVAAANRFFGRSTIIGWPASDDVLNEDSTSIDAMMGKYLIKQFAARPNKGSSVASFLVAWCFSKYDNGCIIRPLTPGVSGGTVTKQWTLFTSRIRVLPLRLPIGRRFGSCFRGLARRLSYGQRLAP